MTTFDTLGFLDEIAQEEKILTYANIEHPARHWPLEEKILYLQGLTLVMNVDGQMHADKQRWIQVLIQSMDMDAEQLWDTLQDFATNPDKETVLAFFKEFRGNSKQQLFLYDALALNQLDLDAQEQGHKIIDKLVEQLKVSSEVWQAVQKLFMQIQAESNPAELDMALLDAPLFRQFLPNSQPAQRAQATGHPILSLLGTMVKIPAGSFMMGSKHRGNEQPVHRVTLNSFMMQEAQLTFAAWDLFVEETGCEYSPDDEGWGRADRPVINVGHNDITESFLPWLNRVTGQEFRLPSEAEWEYACRAGSTTHYSWGNDISPSKANYSDSGHKKTMPVKSYPPNAFGLYDMHGNVWEWVQDYWNCSYQGAPADGSAWLAGDAVCRVLRCGAWDEGPGGVRSASRGWHNAGIRTDYHGFRLVQDC